VDCVLRIQVQKMECGRDLHAHRMVFGKGLMVLGVYVTQDFSNPWMVAHAYRYVLVCLMTVLSTVCPSDYRLFPSSLPPTSPPHPFPPKVVTLGHTYP